jgi:hypothetical protein
MALEQLHNKFNQNNLKVTYKLLNDLLFIEIVFFILALISEGLLPGMIAARVGFSKILIIVGITILSILYTGSKADIELAEGKINKKTAALLVLVLIAFLLASLSRVTIALNLFISLVAIAIGYFTYKLMLGED